MDSIQNVHILEEDKINSDHRLVFAQFYTDISIKNQLKRKKIKYRERLNDPKKWEQFKNTIPPLEEKEGLYRKTEELREKLTDQFDKIFPEKEIDKKDYDRKFFKTKEYSIAKFRKKASYRVLAHIKGVLYGNKDRNENTLRILIDRIPNPPKKIPIEYTQEALCAAHDCEGLFNRTIRALIRKEKREKIRKIVEKIIQKIDANRHNVFKALREQREGETACLIEGNKIITEEIEIKDKLYVTWRDVFKKRTQRSDKIDEFLKYFPKISSPPPSPDFSVTNLKNIIKEKSPTSPGESKVTWQMLKNSPEEYLAKIFKQMYAENLCPLF